MDTVEQIDSVDKKYYIGEKLSQEIKNFCELKVDLNNNKLDQALDYLCLNEIIRRDRMLRKIDSQIAEKIVISIANQIYKVFQEIKPDIILGQLVDYYILDLTYQIAQKNNIKIISIVSGFVNSTYGISKYGEYAQVGNLDIDFFDYFQKKLQPSEVSKSDNVKAFEMFYSGIKSDSKLLFQKYLRYNSYKYYNYGVYTNVNKFHPQTNKWASLSHKYFCSLEHLETIDIDSSIYIPMHFYPEAVIDYWIKNLEMIDYENLLIFLVENNQDLTFILKEHPSMFRRRTYKFYKKLNQYKNVILLEPSIRTFDIFEKVKFVFTWTGTSGVEALFSHKNVITVEKTFYDIDEIAKVYTKNDLLNFRNKMEISSKASTESLCYLDKKLRKSFFRGNFIEFADNESIHKIARDINNLILGS